MTMLFFTLLFIVNCAAFAVFGYDKKKEIDNEKRISDTALMALNICGGAYGAGMAMLLFKSVDDIRRFKIAVPVSFVLWGLVIVLIKIFA
ncbi:MAG: DUF1294 domain-containing protein [Bacteroidales bacterium]|nr:DUF1294 domain-containing protein [Bacteroidales bacterium]